MLRQRVTAYSSAGQAAHKRCSHACPATAEAHAPPEEREREKPAHDEPDYSHRQSLERSRRRAPPSSFRARGEGARGAELRRVRNAMDSYSGQKRSSDSSPSWTSDTLQIAASLGLNQGQKSTADVVANSTQHDVNMPFSLAQFMHDIRSTDVLSAKQEKQLGQAINEYHEIESERNRIHGELGREPSDGELAATRGVDEDELLRLIEQGKWAKRLMVEHNLRLVVSMAKKFTKKGMSLSDLIQEGTFGLLRAIDKFDPSRGFKFSTYCYWWIRQSMQKAVYDQTSTIRVPMNVQFNYQRLMNARRKLMAEGKEPTEQTLAEETGMSEAKVSETLSAFPYTNTLDSSMGDREVSKYDTGGGYDAERLSNAGGTSMDEFEERRDRDQLSQDLEDLLVTLTPRERAVLRMRYCLDNRSEPVSNNELGRMFGVSKERIRRIEQSALTKLASPERAAYVSDHLRERGMVISDEVSAQNTQPSADSNGNKVAAQSSRQNESERAGRTQGSRRRESSSSSSSSSSPKSEAGSQRRQ